MRPLINPNNTAAAAKTGTKYATPACGINHKRTISSCPPICAMAANILKEIGPNQSLLKCCNNQRASKLKQAPLKLNTKLGAKN